MQIDEITQDMFLLICLEEVQGHLLISKNLSWGLQLNLFRYPGEGAEGGRLCPANLDRYGGTPSIIFTCPFVYLC